MQNNELEEGVKNVETTGEGRERVLHIKGVRGKEREKEGRGQKKETA